MGLLASSLSKHESPRLFLSLLARIAGLVGAGIYLLLLAVAPSSLLGFGWTPDFLWSHGEPFLIAALAVVCWAEAYRILRREGSQRL